MSRRARKGATPTVDPATVAFGQAHSYIYRHPFLAPLAYHASIVRQEGNRCPPGAHAIVTSQGSIHVNPTMRMTTEEWIFTLAHCLLHLGFSHFDRFSQGEVDYAWNVACDCVVNSFLAQIKLGKPWPEFSMPQEYMNRREESLFREFGERGVPEGLRYIGTGGAGMRDMQREAEPWWVRKYGKSSFSWQDAFAEGLRQGVIAAVDVAAGKSESLLESKGYFSAAQLARNWFINSFPLLGAMAAAFTIVERADATLREIYINPRCGLDEQEWRFVLAHELLHVGLRHDTRCQGRDPYLWNVACDYVINGWLVEMEVGTLPKIGLLYDPELKGMSSEEIYDRIVTDARRMRKLATLRGVGMGDVLGERPPEWWQAEGTDLDEFYRNCLAQGLAYCENNGRGLLPAGLVEEIRALAQPPIPWDIALARWFDAFFPPLEKHRSYARPSRRQSSTPDIPRPRWVFREEDLDLRTFGVVLDTSGSMDRGILAKALGSIASFAVSRDVPAVRVVFCDAAAYDQGFMPSEDIAERVRVKGRGGTVLQPGVDLLEHAQDFPKDAPILVITDGYCDNVYIRREHAFLLPAGRDLPFPPHGPVFRIPK
jgi:predicted metal-dependent peptidase